MILIIPVLILAFGLNQKSGQTSKYSKIRSVSGLTGAEVAEQILKSNGIFDVQVLPEKASLQTIITINKEVHLSEPIFYGSSVASISVAAHEVGHAIQHARGYYPVVLKKSNFTCCQSWFNYGIPVIYHRADFLFSAFDGHWHCSFAAALAFHLVTLPVRFNASSRAIKQIRELGIVTDSGEIQGCKNMLSAAAMTYVASTLMALMQLIRLIILRGSRK